jgi:hypothetical protein
MEQALELLINNIPAIVIAIIGIVGGIAVKKKWIKQEHFDQLNNDSQVVVNEVYQEYVKFKKAAGGGKLTEEQKEEARQLAIAKLKELGKQKGIDYAKKYGIPFILSLVERLVQRNKA